MGYEEIVKVLAPCGLNCAKCLSYVEGDIKKNAGELKRLLGAFDNYAVRFSRFMPVFATFFLPILCIFLG